MKLYIVNNTPLLDKIEGVAFLNREGDYIKNLLTKAGIDAKNVSFSYLRENIENDLKSADFGIIISLGAIPTSLLLKLPKSIKLEQHVGKCYPYGSKIVIPWYAASHLLIRGKKVEKLTLDLFGKIKGMLK